MKTASLNEIKKELHQLSEPLLRELSMRMAKYKKENKELLGYLLFEAQDEASYIRSVKAEMDIQFTELHKNNLYLTTKAIRKALKITNKYCKYSGIKQTEVELLIYFCSQLKSSGIPFHRSTMLVNLYNRQLDKINKAINKLHEDLQFDYRQELEKIA